MSVILTITTIALTIELALITAGVFVRDHYSSEFNLYINIAVIPICAAFLVFALAQLEKKINEMELQDEDD